VTTAAPSAPLLSTARIENVHVRAAIRSFEVL
jgi:hypothetical protein